MPMKEFELYKRDEKEKEKKKEDLGRGGTEAFPGLGTHCQYPDCYQLDFLPFHCDRCRQTFCLDHRTYKSHDCTRPDERNRKVFVCKICSTSIETTGIFGHNEKAIIDKHLNSKDCDPAKKEKPRCPVPRCKENLTFSNNVICKYCNVKFCLNHRFPSHACLRSGNVSCGRGSRSSSAASSSRSVEAY